MNKKKSVAKIIPLFDVFKFDFKVFFFAILIFFTGCLNDDNGDDITKLLGFLDVQNYKGYKKYLNGNDLTLSNQKNWYAADVLFEKSENYQNSSFYRIDSLVKLDRLEEALKLIDNAFIQIEKDSIDILKYHLVSKKCLLLIKLNKFNQFKEFEDQSNIKFGDDNSLLKLYYFLKYNEFRVKYYAFGGLYEEAIRFGQLGLFHLEINDLDNEWKGIYIDYLLATSKALRENWDEGDLEESSLYFEKAFAIEKKYQIREILPTIAANLSYAFSELGDHVKAKKYEKYASERKAIHKGLGYLVNKDYRNAKIQFHKHLNLLIESECKIEKFRVYGYLAEAHMMELSIDSATFYLDKAYDFDQCSEYIKSETTYYILEIQFEYLRILDSLQNIGFDKVVDPLLTRRMLGYKTLLDASGSHMSDFLMRNTTRYLSYVMDKFGLNIPKRYHQSIINLVGEAKRTKSFVDIKKAKRFKEHAATISLLKQKIEQNRFQLVHTDSAYYKLGMLYSKISDVSTPDSIPELDINIHNENSILNFVYYEDSYWMYHKRGINFVLNEYNSDSIDYYISAIWGQVKSNNGNVESIRQKFKEYLNLEEIQNEKITILPDGDLIGFPFNLLFEDDNVSIIYKYGLYNSMDLKLKLDIDKGIGLVSYTDKTTSAVTSEILKHVELVNGYQECLYIRDSLIPNAQLIAGNECTKINYESLLVNDVLHISSHALSDESSKYETSILLRDIKGQADSLYGYELLNYKMPKFIFLNACETSVGYVQVGDGVYSFSRYCQMAGSQTVISTLWKVKDGIASQFSKTFYKKWLSGNSVLSAFTEAQNHIKKLYDDPLDWAPFVLEGNPNLYLSPN